MPGHSLHPPAPALAPVSLWLLSLHPGPGPWPGLALSDHLTPRAPSCSDSRQHPCPKGSPSDWSCPGGWGQRDGAGGGAQVRAVAWRRSTADRWRRAVVVAEGEGESDGAAPGAPLPLPRVGAAALGSAHLEGTRARCAARVAGEVTRRAATAGARGSPDARGRAGEGGTARAGAAVSAARRRGRQCACAVRAAGRGCRGGSWGSAVAFLWAGRSLGWAHRLYGNPCPSPVGRADDSVGGPAPESPQ